MRNLYLFTAALTLAAPAFAQDQSIQVTGTLPAYHLQPQQLAEVAGIYQLDNGGVMRITQANNRLVAQLDGRAATELVAQSDSRFISRDQRMTIDYQPQAFGDLIVLRYPSDLARADAPMVTVRLARN